MILDLTDPDSRAEAIEAAVQVVRDGRLLVLPTDTVYGVGADAFDHVAVAMVLAAKHRGREMPPPVLVPSPRTVDGLATGVPMYAKILMRRFWPGGLTLVLRAQPSLTWDIGETNGTVALRMPQDDIALAVLSETGPMAVTSANLSGQPAATTAQEAQEQLGGAVSLYLDGGPREGTAASTIVDCTGEEPVVLRHGVVSAQELREVLGGTVLHDAPPVGGEGADRDSDVAPEPVSDAAPDLEPAVVPPAVAPAGAGRSVTGSGPRLVGTVQPTALAVSPSSRRVVTPPARADAGKDVTDGESGS